MSNKKAVDSLDLVFEEECEIAPISEDSIWTLIVLLISFLRDDDYLVKTIPNTEERTEWIFEAAVQLSRQLRKRRFTPKFGYKSALHLKLTATKYVRRKFSDWKPWKRIHYDSSKLTELAVVSAKSPASGLSNSEKRKIDNALECVLGTRTKVEQVFLIRTFDRPRYKRIGELVGITTGNARRKYCDACRKLKELLEPMALENALTFQAVAKYLEDKLRERYEEYG